MRKATGVAASGALAAGAAVLTLIGAYRPLEAPVAFGVAAAVVAATVAVGMVLLAIARPWPGVLLLMAAMPIVAVARAQLFIGPVQVLPVTLVVVALVVGRVLRGDAQPAPGTAPLPRARTWWLLAIAAALAVAATVMAPGSDALNITLHGVLEPVVVFGLVIALRPSSEQALQALLAVAAGVAIATVINLSWLAVVLVPHDLYEQRLLLARLTYFNAGIFGTMLVTAIPAATAPLFFRERFPSPRIAAIGASAIIGLFVVALFFTYTKSAWLSAAVVAALLILLLVRGWQRRLPMLLGVALLLAAVVPYPLPLLRAVAPGWASGYESFLLALQGPARFESWDPETYQGSGSIAIRIEAVGAAAEMAAGSPWLGVGPGGFQAEFARIRPNAGVPGLQSAHNLLPNLAAEYGLPLALLVAAGLTWAVVAAFGRRRSAGPVPRVAGTLIGISLVGFLSMATLFGVDLYRVYRTMNLDVVTVALLAALSYSLARVDTTSS
jgi:O-antigen ligase